MSKMREAFEKWLLDEQGLPCTWNEQRNCYDEFPAHLAWKAYQAAIAAIREGGVVWMTHESAYRLKRGGNGKGAVPVHKSASNIARIPFYRLPDDLT